MPANSPSRLTKLVLSASVIANAVLGGHALYVEGTQRVTGNIETGGVLVQSGGLLPISGDLALSEVNGSASGALSIQNPYDQDVLCDQLVIDVTTASSPVARVDVGTATGAVAPGTLSGTNLFDNLVLNTGVFTASGSAVKDAGGYRKTFKLDAAGGANDYIQIKSRAQSGSGLAGTYRANCFARR